MFSTLVTLAFAATQVSSLAIKRNTYPFSKIVAFGDELSDNGNGSYAHGIMGDKPGDKEYGFPTWTDGPVAVSYLADLLGLPLTDYAFGSSGGGATQGAMLDNSWSVPGTHLTDGSPAPSLYDQVNNAQDSDFDDALAFLWLGVGNDFSAHQVADPSRPQSYICADSNFDTSAFAGGCSNSLFVSTYVSKVVALAEKIASRGSKYVFIGNVYARHLAPVMKFMSQPDNDDWKKCLPGYEALLTQTNQRLKDALQASPSANRFIYYDSYQSVSAFLQFKDYFGIDADPYAICDSGNKADWNGCLGGASDWDASESVKKHYWFDWVQMETQVHKFVGLDMHTRVNQFLASGQ